MITIQTVSDIVDGRKNVFLQYQCFMHISLSISLANSQSLFFLVHKQEQSLHCSHLGSFFISRASNVKLREIKAHAPSPHTRSRSCVCS